MSTDTPDTPRQELSDRQALRLLAYASPREQLDLACPTGLTAEEAQALQEGFATEHPALTEWLATRDS